MIELIPHSSRSTGIDFNDFQLGYSIVSERMADKYIFNIDQSEQEERDIENAYTTKPSFDKRVVDRISLAIETIKATLNFPCGDRVLSNVVSRILENRASGCHVEFHQQGPNREELVAENWEMVTDMAHTIGSDLIRWLTLSNKIAERVEALRPFWGDKTDKYVNYIINRFTPEYVRLKAPARWTELVRNLEGKLEIVKKEDPAALEELSKYTMEAGRAILADVSKKNGRRWEKEEGRLVFSLLGLLSLGYEASFPVLFWQLDTNSFRDMAQAINSYAWWTLASRVQAESASDGEEPIFLVTEDSKYGPHFTLDYDDLCRMIQAGTGEYEFKNCFNTYQFVNDKGIEEQMYFKTYFYEENKASIEKAVKLGNWIATLFDKDVNLHSYKIKTEGHKWENLGVLQVIEFEAGKRWRKVKRMIRLNPEDKEETEVSCKKMSNKNLVDFHERKLKELFWGLYRDQQNRGIIAAQMNMME